MSKNTSAITARSTPHHGLKNVRTLVSCALLAAVSVVLARFIVPMPNETTRFSIEAVPIFLAGMLFGPLPGALVGFAADFVGCLFSGYGYNPLFCLPPCIENPPNARRIPSPKHRNCTNRVLIVKNKPAATSRISST